MAERGRRRLPVHRVAVGQRVGQERRARVDVVRPGPSDVLEEEGRGLEDPWSIGFARMGGEGGEGRGGGGGGGEKERVDAKKEKTSKITRKHLRTSPPVSPLALFPPLSPFCTLFSGVRYSFISAGSTVNGPHASATTAIATVVQTRICRSCTFKLLSKATSTSWGPIARAMKPNVETAARRTASLGALSSSSSSKQTRIHSLAGTPSAARSAMRPTRSTQVSWTRSWRFFRIGVRRGSRSRTGGCILSATDAESIPLPPLL